MTRDTRSYTGEYRLLFIYLRDRFADRVVLTFGEIEDLLGFPLPAPARLEIDWWRDTGGEPTAQAAGWIAASRTAVANLISQRVIFDRRL